MKEVDERIKWGVGRPAVALILTALRRVIPGVRPPLAGSLARFRDHGIEQHQHGDRHAPAHERRSEACQRLRDQNHVPGIPIADRADDSLSILGQASGVVCRGKGDRVRLVPTMPKLWRNQMPVPCTAASAGNEDEGASLHRKKSPSATTRTGFWGPVARSSRQLTAFFTSAEIFASSAAVST